MDKPTVLALIEDGVICSCFREWPCEHALGCKRYALIDPSALAQLEAQAARVPELERENERFNGLAAKAQGLYEVVTDLSDSTHHFCEEFCNKLKPDGTCEPDDCPVWIAQHKAKASLVCYVCFRNGHSGILCPIVNSEEDVAKAEEDARIGRVVREYIDGQKKHGYYQSRSTPYQQGVADVIDAVEIVITKAREVENRG